jgi:hypothetical protein
LVISSQEGETGLLVVPGEGLPAQILHFQFLQVNFVLEGEHLIPDLVVFFGQGSYLQCQSFFLLGSSVFQSRISIFGLSLLL